MNKTQAKDILKQYLSPDLLQEVIDVFEQDDTMKTSLHLLTANILSLRTEVLLIKAELMELHDEIRSQHNA